MTVRLFLKKFVNSHILLFISFFSITLALCQNALSAEGHKPVIVVCCSGKSGSTTLEKSFQNVGFSTSRYHSINQERAYEILNSSDSIIMIDAIRDPISRRISSFFENITSHLELTQNQILEIYQKDGLSFFQNEFDKKIVDLEQYYGFESWRHYHYDCLRDGIFDFKNKYQLEQRDKLYFVNLRFDDIGHWEEIIKSIPLPINLEDFTIISTNIGDEKWYGHIYRDYCDHFTLTQAQFYFILCNNMEEIIHFWGIEGVLNFIDKWTPYIRD